MTTRAKIKNKYPKPLGKGKLYDKRINTKLEKRIQQIAQNEVDRNKKQKCLTRILFGRLVPPVISADSATGEDDKYEEARIIGPQYVTKDFLKDDVGTPINGASTVRRSIFMFPQTRQSLEVQAGGDETNYKKFGTNANAIYSDYDEIGHTRGSNEILLKGFRIQGEFLKNTANLSDEVEVSLAVYKVNAEYAMDQRTAQYILPHTDQAQVCPKRIIKEYLGSDINTNQPMVPDTEQIKSRILYKRWSFRPRQELYLAADAANLKYNERKINFDLYCETNQKIEYARGFTGAVGGMKNSNIALNTDSISGFEQTDKFEGVKYCCVIKSNIPQANQALHAPKLIMGLTCYWTDIMS